MVLYATLFLAGVREVGHDGKLTGAPAVSLDDIKASASSTANVPAIRNMA